MTKIGRMIFEDGFKEGMKEGFEEGIKIGREEGIKRRKVQIAERMLKKNIELDIIMEATGLTREEIEAIQHCWQLFKAEIEELSMTKIGRMIFEDGIKKGKEQIAERLLKKNIELDMIMEVTDLTREEIKAIQQELLAMEISTIS